MANSPSNGIPYVPEGTTDPAAALNSALNVIDALLNSFIKGFATNTPPGSPADGDQYIVGTSPTGAWVGHSNALARWVATGSFWQFFPAGTQARYAILASSGLLYIWNSTSSTWTALSAGAVAWGSITGTLTSQTDLVAALLAAQTQLVGINAQTGTTYTLVLTDAGKDVQCTNASAIALTVPPNSSVAFPVGTGIIVSQGGAGAVTITAGSGVTLRTPSGAATTAIYDARVIEKIATDTWRVW